MSTIQCQTYQFPTLIRFGPGVIGEIGPHLLDKGFKAPLIVTDTTCAELPFFKKIVDKLKSHQLSVEVFQEIHSNPLKSDVEKGVEMFTQTKRDSIIGLGGGASLDVARAIALKAHHPGDLFDYEEAKGGDKLITQKIPYFICVPTTSGTGSEVGRSTIIADDETKMKKILFSPHLMAKIVFADPELTMDLPPHITAATGMDALTHHVEAFLAKGFHPLCDGIAIEGIKLVHKNLEKATHNPDITSRSNMMMAALMGAVAFQKGLGVVHSTAHPLSTLYDTHHGLANAIMLPHGIRYNIPQCHEKMQYLSDSIWSHDFVKSVQELIQKLHLPSKLSEIGIEEEDIGKLAKLAYKDPCHACNPRPVTEKDFETIYKDAL